MNLRKRAFTKVHHLIKKAPCLCPSCHLYRTKKQNQSACEVLHHSSFEKEQFILGSSHRESGCIPKEKLWFITFWNYFPGSGPLFLHLWYQCNHQSSCQDLAMQCEVKQGNKPNNINHLSCLPFCLVICVGWCALNRINQFLRHCKI